MTSHQQEEQLLLIARLAQLVERTTLNRVVVGSIPTMSVLNQVTHDTHSPLHGPGFAGTSRGMCLP